MRKALRYIILQWAAPALLLAAGEHSGRRAPGFSLPDANLQQHDLYDYRGKVVIVEFIQTACPNCQAFAKVLNEIPKRYGDQVAVLSIAVPPDQVGTVQKYMADFQVRNPVLIDCGAVALSYLRPPPHAPTIHVPHLFLIDRAGTIRNDFHHDADSAEIFGGPGFFREIDKLVGKAPVRKK